MVQKARRQSNIFTAEKKAAFLRLFAAGNTVKFSAQSVGVDPTSIYGHIRKDDEFAKAFAEAREFNLDNLEDLLLEQGRNGAFLPTIATLRAFRPERWSDKAKIEHSGTVVVTTAEMLQAARDRVRTMRDAIDVDPAPVAITHQEATTS